MPIYFFDVEASGFNGYPIEVGWTAIVAKNKFRKGSFLVHHPDWLENGIWDEGSALIHHISQADIIENGQSLAVAAQLLNIEMPQFVYSDAPNFDQGWVGQIFETASIEQKFQIMDQNLLLDDVDPIAYRFAERTITDIAPRTHRADADAYRLALLYHLAKYGEITNLL